MPFDPVEPFNDLPDLPPPVELETKAILKASIAAREALAQLRLEAQRLPNPNILVGSLSLLEARASSEIENIVTTDDALFRQSAIDGEAGDSATKEALRYRHALYEGMRNLGDRPLTTRTAVAICRRIKGIDIEIRRVPGTTLRSSRNGAAIYTPPVGESLIREKLANWERYLHEDEADPLVRLAVQHYQFEAIHPFGDGNGRTGRVLSVLFLIEQGLIDAPILYMSREILASREDYYGKLLGVTRDGAWHDWIVYMLDVVRISARESSLQASRIAILMAHTELFIRKTAPALASRDLLDVLFTQPYCRIANLIERGIAKRQTASVYLRKLVDLGVLQEVRVGREKIFYHAKLAELLATDGSGIMPYQRNALARSAPLFPAGRPAPDRR